MKQERKKIVTERINQLLSENGKSGRWVCKFVLNYPSSGFSNFTSGQRMPPEWILEKLAEYFNVREAWIHGFDNYKTEQDLIRAVDYARSDIEIYEDQFSDFYENKKIPAINATVNRLKAIIEKLNLDSISDFASYCVYMEDSINNAHQAFIKQLKGGEEDDRK